MENNKTDKGYFKWIKKPGQNGRLALGSTKNDMEELDNNTLNQIVTEVKNWYAYKHVA